jgi:4-hydroxybenzoate polyprenyltransferase
MVIPWSKTSAIMYRLLYYGLYREAAIDLKLQLLTKRQSIYNAADLSIAIMQETIVMQDRKSTSISPSRSIHERPKQPPTSHSFSYHFHTLILFTHDQFFDTIIPGTCFSLLSTLSGAGLSLPSRPAIDVLLRTPFISSWLWLIILQFCLQNQCSEGSPEEDAINKPWRPIPSQRITLAGAKKLLLATHFVAGLASWYLGVFYLFVAWTVLATLYNDLGGSDCSGLVRNLFCGGFFSCSFGGALVIGLGDVEISREALRWTLLVCWCILLTTIQTQEFRDEVGDKARGRKTLVTELGRVKALWTVYVTVTFWSL